MLDPLALRQIGRTAVRITRFGFGGTTLGGRHVYSDVTEAQAVATVTHAHDAGIRYFDTAPFYGLGNSETRMGLALRALPSDCVLSTKVGYLLRPCDPGLSNGNVAVQAVVDYSYDATLRGLKESIERLGGRHIDIAYIHDVDKGPFFDAAMRGAYPALERLRHEGAIGAIGVGVSSWELCLDFARQGDFDCFMLAARYSLLEQGGTLHNFLPFCAERGIGVIIAAPFNSGILASGPVANARYNYGPATAEILNIVKRLQDVCRRHGVLLPAAALQFPLAHPAVTGMVIGSRSPDELSANLTLIRQPIPGALWDELKHEGLLDPAAPVPGPC